MDIHLLPGFTAVAPAASGKTAAQDQTLHETFQNVLGNVVPKVDKVTDAARQFEALIVGQVLKASREASGGGWLGSDDDQTGQLALEMAEQGFAQALASRGGLGIAKMMSPTLRRDEAKAAASGQPAPHSLVPPSKDSGR